MNVLYAKFEGERYNIELLLQSIILRIIFFYGRLLRVVFRVKARLT